VAHREKEKMVEQAEVKLAAPTGEMPVTGLEDVCEAYATRLAAVAEKNEKGEPKTLLFNEAARRGNNVVSPLAEQAFIEFSMSNQDQIAAAKFLQTLLFTEYLYYVENEKSWMVAS
jgi:hypothetical protein